MSLPEPGTTYGRWKVEGRATPAKRYGESYSRARVHVRCVCGSERDVFVNDLRSGKTSGCRSADCRIRWMATRMVKERLADFLAAGRTEETADG